LKKSPTGPSGTVRDIGQPETVQVCPGVVDDPGCKVTGDDLGNIRGEGTGNVSATGREVEHPLGSLRRGKVDHPLQVGAGGVADALHVGIADGFVLGSDAILGVGRGWRLVRGHWVEFHDYGGVSYRPNEEIHAVIQSTSAAKR
jgi:hypothetical protein